MRMQNFTIIVCILVCCTSNYGFCGLFGDLLNEAGQITTSALKVVKLPTSKEFFEMSSAAVNSKTLSVKPQFTPKVDNISFILKTKTSEVEFALTDPHGLWNHKEFNRDWPLVIFVTGWKTNLAEKIKKSHVVMTDAYLCRGKVKFVTVDTADFLDTLYSWSAFNTEIIGGYIGQALQTLVENYSTEKIHLIGHSLGAHICGAAGRSFNRATKRLVRRITGLDPANPCFYNGGALTGLGRGDADWVDIIHTNPGALGKKDAIGDCDFYPNGIKYPLQPGSFDIHESHNRAWEYFAETVYPGNERNFLARKCTSMKELDSQYCNGELYPMGYAAPFNLKGNYFLKTNSKSPYGENATKNYRSICAN